MSDWQELSWEIPANRQPWFVDRLRLMGEKARAFEIAMESAAAAGEAALSKVPDELSEWEIQAGNIWMYAGLNEGRQVAPEDIPVHVEELAKTWKSLKALRTAILGKLGEAAASKIRSREATVKVDAAQLRDRAGELPSFTPEVDALGSYVAYAPLEVVEKPVSVDELKLRQTAEGKLLPDSGNLGALLAILPSEWVNAIFETLELAPPPDDDMTAGSKSAVRRGIIHTALHSEDFLRDVVYTLPEEDSALLRDLVAAKGLLPYTTVAANYGRDDADGFFWRDRPPSGALARLRRVGLAFVGNRRGQPTVQLPADLLATVKSLVERPEP